MSGVTRDEIDRQWWKEAVVYQIYPRSFNDTDGNGVGDIPGIIEKLDYLDYLGVDCIWLNPVYESPNADNGYDIADYRSIMAEFGTMDDWEDLLEGLHDRDIRLIMDLVVNHTSDEHEWFVNSRDEPDSEYRDYYIWRQGRTDVDGFTGHRGPEGEAPPNEWGSFFGGPAWEYDEASEEWYLHLFDVKQPDLNWENEQVREDVFEMMEFWLEKGIDGFRMDVINLISKPDAITQHDPPEPSDFGGTIDGPKVHEYLGEMGDRVLSEDLLTVGECIGSDMAMDEAQRYVGRDGDGLSMIFHFEHVLLDQGGEIWETSDWDLRELKGVFSKWQHGLQDDGWNSLYLNNHDQPRMVSRFGNDEEYRRESAKLLGTLLHTMQGTPYVYQGEELGMTNVSFDSLEEFRDVETLQPVRNALESGDIDSFEQVREGLEANSRDNARTPMQWDDTDNAGFTTGEPWLKVAGNHDEINVEVERGDPDSVLEYYRRLFDLRDDHEILVYGGYDDLWFDHPELWSYTRSLDDERLLVTLNFSDTETFFEVPNPEDHDGDHPIWTPDVDGADEVELLLSNYDEVGETDDPSEYVLRPWEARVYHLTGVE
ncbi:alpha-glucosidase [Halobium salinum]|uniref:Alpha-glucosidase n=1 Tax=Halobium salinum TaxID=1364940 RepID=A0ABD5PCU2_9EURY|nr:alpha-glucosidase [Halobium salinum]